MKKLILVLLLLSLFLLTACNKTDVANSDEDGRMTVVYNDGFVMIYQDNETGVQYFCRYNCGSCVMVNPDGTPYLKGGKDD